MSCCWQCPLNFFLILVPPYQHSGYVSTSDIGKFLLVQADAHWYNSSNMLGPLWPPQARAWEGQTKVLQKQMKMNGEDAVWRLLCHETSYGVRVSILQPPPPQFPSCWISWGRRAMRSAATPSKHPSKQAPNQASLVARLVLGEANTTVLWREKDGPCCSTKGAHLHSHQSQPHAIVQH